MSGYKFDVFISYSRRGSAQKWLMNHFLPKFQDCLADEIAPTPNIFVDKRMNRAVHWPEELERALRDSKVMIAVLTPPYFHSPWCTAEFESMRAREKYLGLTGLERPQGLIYPILYSDSDNFPATGRELAWWDFKDLATPDPVFQESREWISFHRKVSDFARDLVELLHQVPEWRPDWPVIKRPEPVLATSPPIPRFDP